MAVCGGWNDLLERSNVLRRGRSCRWSAGRAVYARRMILNLLLGCSWADRERERVMAKPISKQAWAVTNSRGRMVLVDGRLPIFWLRKLAKDFAEKHGLRDARVRPVVVNEVFGR